ncbi:hypothetical protein C0Q70_01150 [Pomacea canaliculata]|uniref:GST N-terminal domain-containing protein n=1 Tax=Pomacea canaliculata TaxID=400727 RepID=A0A2T7PYN8_POMCA|nr:hypothetical protein C0Q70_01150 [Pomacea canaliculata]
MVTGGRKDELELGDNTHRVCFAELGIEDQLELVTLPMEIQPPPPEREEYRQRVHPHSTVPALEVEGQPPIIESAAICLFLADLCGSLAPELGKRADWIIYSCCAMDEILVTLFHHWELLPPEKKDQQVLDKTSLRPRHAWTI